MKIYRIVQQTGLLYFCQCQYIKKMMSNRTKKERVIFLERVSERKWERECLFCLNWKNGDVVFVFGRITSATGNLRLMIEWVLLFGVLFAFAERAFGSQAIPICEQNTVSVYLSSLEVEYMRETNERTKNWPKSKTKSN